MRPDLAGLPFETMLRLFRQNAVEDYAISYQDYLDQKLSKKPILHSLVKRAYAYDPDHSIGYYRLQYAIMEKRLELVEAQNIDLTGDHALLLADNIGLRDVAKQAVDIATNAVGPIARQN
ncbi:hypothetical protein [Spirosoma foliorum]|uniref:Uncharacterized protein n=1 Tax=Spirosoma foliorum TaxID=2710596 RepID=A0A7G5GTV4_9BACT|nr:hypothetical protein [Spirosoma foliorum]QMW02296.1 hypothetical protein H3H32_30965 [Spirosoma foliorum]